jgi:hypothetical protein
MAYDPSRRFPDPHCGPHQRPTEAHHGDAGDRQVDDGASLLGAVRQDQRDRLVVMADAVVAAVFGDIEDVSVCEPRQLRRWYFDVSQISGAIPGGDIEAAAQRDGEVSKIATDAALLGKCLLRSPCRAGMFVAECDVP